MEKLIVFFTLIVALFLFISGKLRHDIIAIICLLFLVLTGIIQPSESFAGFAHPAVITVAMILIVSSALQHSGLIDFIGSNFFKNGKGMVLQIAILCVIVTFISAFINNVGALAITMPIAIHTARKSGNNPSYYLMPLAFCSLLGGMTTLIGTPPNIIIGAFREQSIGKSFEMLDFAIVGIPVALAGLIYIVLIGWRLLPKRETNKSNNNLFEIKEYITEVKVSESSLLIGKTFSDIEKLFSIKVNILGLVKNNCKVQTPSNDDIIEINDIIIIEADSTGMKLFVEKTKSQLNARKQLKKTSDIEDELIMTEAVIKSNSPLIQQSASSLQLRTRYGVNLLAVSRHGRKIIQCIDKIQFQTGDVLLIHGYRNNINETLQDLYCLPLADRGFDINKPNKIFPALLIFGISIILAITGILEIHIAFTLAALLMILLKVLPLKNLYTSIDWTVIVLLGAMLPVGIALETSGGATFIAEQILSVSGSLPLWLTLGLFLLTTMGLSAIINNAATVVLMAPIGIDLALGLNVSVDAFLMATAIGGSCAFLSPVGHQSNTLVMGPGGYKFTDYTRMGFPLTIITTIIAIIMIMNYWL